MRSHDPTTPPPASVARKTRGHVRGTSDESDAFIKLATKLAHAFTQAEETYLPLTTEDIIQHNER